MNKIIFIWVTSILSILIVWVVTHIKFRREVKALEEEFLRTEARYDYYEKLIKEEKWKKTKNNE